MLARLLRLITLGAAILVVSSISWALGSGHLAWGLTASTLVAGSYAIVLALEFILLRALNTEDPTPRATLAQLASAWGRETISAPRVFCWRQPFFSRRWPDRTPYPSNPPTRGVLLVHGFMCNRGIWNRWLRRLTLQGRHVVAVNLEPVFGDIDDCLHLIDSAVSRLQNSTGMAPIVVAHSMGGLALRRWWADPGNDTRVHHAITIGTPHHGTWLARFAITRNARQMQLHSPWIRQLAAGEPPGRAGHFTCFYSHCDNIVFPPLAATLAGANNRHLPGVAHVCMIDHPAPWQALERWLAEPDRAASPN